MLIVLFLILTGAIIGTYFGIYRKNETYFDENNMGWSILNVLSWCLMFITVVVALVLGTGLAGEKALDQKIQMHEDENARIEIVIKAEVQNYLQHEYNVYTQIGDEDVEVLILRYPELGSNTLVQQQITLLQENNKIIRELKTQKINLIVYRWWLYFGC